MSHRPAHVQPTEPASRTLQIYLLGPPEVAWADEPLVIRRRLPRAVLYCLAARLQPVPREQLCFLFWPDSPDATARRATGGGPRLRWQTVGRQKRTD